MQDRGKVFPPDDLTAMGADAGLLCICARYALTFLINPEISLESGDCPDLLSPTRLPQVCAQCMHRMAGNHHTPFTAAHLHGKSDPSEKHQRPVTSMHVQQGAQTNHVSSTCSACRNPPPGSSLYQDCPLSSRGGEWNWLSRSQTKLHTYRQTSPVDKQEAWDSTAQQWLWKNTNNPTVFWWWHYCPQQPQRVWHREGN